MGEYKQGLNKIQEDLFSENFFVRALGRLDHDYQQHDYKNRYSSLLTCDQLERFVQITKDASKVHTSKTIKRIRARILPKLEQGGDPLNTVLREVVGDRQFMKGPKHYLNWKNISDKARDCFHNNSAINCIIVGLPFKMPTLLKCSSQLPDFAEASFLLQLNEFCEVLRALLICHVCNDWTGFVSFRVICDGRRFNKIVGRDEMAIVSYMNGIEFWILRYGLNNIITIDDYLSVTNKLLPRTIKNRKKELRLQALQIYNKRLGRKVTWIGLDEHLQMAVQNDPDPEESNEKGRFCSLFLSLLFTIRFRCIEHEAILQNCSYDSLYEHCICLITKRFNAPRSTFTSHQSIDPSIQLLDALLTEAWCATIEYIAEIRSDRDLDQDLVQSCFPTALRWSIHSKSGQIGLNCTRMNGIAIWPWHGVAVFKPSQRGLKNYNLPESMIDTKQYLPLTAVINGEQQLLAYIYCEEHEKSISSLMDRLASSYTRRVNG